MSIKAYPDLIDALINRGAWGPHEVSFPFAMQVLDRVEVDNSMYVATKYVEFPSQDRIKAAIRDGVLVHEEVRALGR